MENATPLNFTARPATPMNADSFAQPFEAAGRGPRRPGVLDSPGLQDQPASFQAFHGDTDVSTGRTASQQRPVREREAELLGDGGERDTKISKNAGSRFTYPGHHHREPSSASAGIGYVYGSGSRSTPLTHVLAYPSGVSFTVTAQELTQLRAASARPLVETGSSSHGTFLVQFTDSAAEPLEARGPASGIAVNQGAPAPAPVADEQVEAAPQAPLDPVNSKFAKTLRSKLRKALRDGATHAEICSQLLRPSAGDYFLLREKRWAFTPEFLVTVLKMLPDLDSSQITTLGKAVGCLGVPANKEGTRKGAMNGSLGGKARSVIGEALVHEAIQSRVSLDMLMDFLLSADKTEPRPDKDRTSPRRQYSHPGGRYGIPQALGKRLGREAEATSPEMRDSVRATTARLALMLSDDTRKHLTHVAVIEGIDASPASAAVKAWLKDEFKTAFLLSPLASEGEELSADEGS